MMISWLAFVNCFWLLVTPSSEAPTHAIYLSLTELELSEGKAEFNVKVFSDDLRDALKNHDPSGFQPRELDQFFSANKALVQPYFSQYLQLEANGKSLDLDLKGYSIEGDAHFIHFESLLPDATSALTVTASFLMELFPTQMNVVKVKKGTETQFLRFNHPAEPQTINFQP